MIEQVFLHHKIQLTFIASFLFLTIISRFTPARPFWWVFFAIAILWVFGLSSYYFLKETESEHRRAMNTLIADAKMYQDSIRRMALPELNNQVISWVAAIEEMAAQLVTYYEDPVIQRDVERVPKQIESLRFQIAQEKNTSVRKELEITLELRRKQWARIVELEGVTDEAEIRIQQTLARMGEIYSQLIANPVTSHVADYGRATTDIEEEAASLRDKIEALKEVKFGVLT